MILIKSCENVTKFRDFFFQILILRQLHKKSENFVKLKKVNKINFFCEKTRQKFIFGHIQKIVKLKEILHFHVKL